MSKNYAPSAKSLPGKIVRIGQLDLYVEELGSGEPLLLLHGFGGCTRNWYPFLDPLAERYRLLLVDLRGHGHSTNPEMRFTHQKAAQDVFQLLDTLGIRQFYAMGMSTGGMVLLHMAKHQPDRVRAMVLISATTHFPEQARAIMKRASYSTLPPEVRDMYKECANRGEEQVRQLIEQFNELHDNYDDVNFSEEELATISAPALIIHGERDSFFPVAIARKMQKSIPEAQLWLIADGDHVPVFDRTVPFTTKALHFLDYNILL